MAINNFGLPFNLHNTQKFDLRNRPSKYAESDIRRWDFEQSEGTRPAEYYAPYKFLPVCFQDITTEDYVVLPKGRIVSAVTTEDTTVSGRIVYPASSGSIPIGLAAPEMGGAVINASIDDSWFGYTEYTVGLLVPANGGETYSGFYTTDDVAAKTMKADGNVVASGATTFELPANAPIGVVYHDWYQDIRGKYLNYTMHADGGHVLTDWYVEVPYFKVSDTGSLSGVSPQYVNNDYANLVKYWNINKSFAYLTVASDDVFRAGVFVQSDLIGNYKIQGGAASLTQNKTVQTVGKVLAIDNRFPKGALEDVLTYPRSGMPGSQTAGIPKVLFDFVYYVVLDGTGTAPTVEDIYNFVRAGTFGMARIQILVS